MSLPEEVTRALGKVPTDRNVEGRCLLLSLELCYLFA